MSNESIPVTVQLMETEYRVACSENNRESLLAAADYLNGKMLEIRDSGKLLGVERIAVMAALNISHELLTGKQETFQGTDATNARLQQLLEKVETALNKVTQVTV
jgi:cell division protein ZapA